MKKFMAIGWIILNLKLMAVVPVYDVANHQANEVQKMESIRQTIEQVLQTQGLEQQLKNEAKHLVKLDLKNTLTGLASNATGLSKTKTIQLGSAAGTLFSAPITGGSVNINIGPKIDALYKNEYSSGITEKELKEEKKKLEKEVRASTETALKVSSKSLARVDEAEKFNNYIMKNIDTPGSLETQQLANHISAKNMVAITDTNVLLSELVKAEVINQQNEIQKQKIEDRKKEIILKQINLNKVGKGIKL